MTEVNAESKEQTSNAEESSLLTRERRQIRIMQILFLAFSIVLIISLVFSLFMNP